MTKRGDIPIPRSRTLYQPVMIAAAVLVSCAVAVSALSEKAGATFPGKNGRIAYVSLTQNRFANVYTINPDGSGKFRVTNTKKTSEESPDYSPDGKKIAYEGWNRNYVSHIYIISATGGKPFQLTNNKTTAFDPSYSPNGKKIAYSGCPKRGRNCELYTISATGGKRVKLTNNNKLDFSPTYSPDGKKIAYSTSDGHGLAIYKIKVTGGKPFNVTNDTKKKTGSWRPSWGSRP